ncbi:MAG: dihydroorotate dehydrogenase electron transfer subunit [Desulfobacteraceae bacterium]|nr:dihydroorotate dehydrogenase electron transfer subunit [Desulfobacteraceae bacterium]
MNQLTATVLWNHHVGPNYFRLGLGCPQPGFTGAEPGQFVMVRSNPSVTPLLRRPFSIAGLIGNAQRPEGIELLFRVVGQGTRHLSDLTPGQGVDLIGPLGRGFKLSPKAKRFYLAAGGIGVAPIRFLAHHLITQGVEPGNCRVFLGGRTQGDLLCREEFAALGFGVTATTDDGSEGMQCLITDPLEEAIQAKAPDLVCACGPHGMLQCVAGIAARHQVACQISMETMMACGLGACLGCAVPAADTQEKYRHVCIEGPVFDVRQVAW